MSRKISFGASLRFEMLTIFPASRNYTSSSYEVKTPGNISAVIDERRQCAIFTKLGTFLV